MPEQLGAGGVQVLVGVEGEVVDDRQRGLRPAAVIDQLVGQPNHRRRIDYSFVGAWEANPEAHCRVEAARLAFDQPEGGVWASDHLGVAVEVEIGSDVRDERRIPALPSDTHGPAT